MTWNGIALLKRCLPSVVQSNYDNLEIIIADNNSTDGSADWVRDTYPQVRILEYPENYAFCRGNNEAIKVASGDIVVLLNNDVEVPAGWIGPLVSILDENPKIGAAQPKLLQFDNRDFFEYSGGAGGHLDKYGFPFTKGRIFFTMEEDRGQYDDPAEIFWASGAAIAMKKSVLDEVGLLDEQFVLHMEEIDLCWRIKRAGYDIVCQPSSEVYHIGGASLPASSPQKVYYNYRNGILLLYKNLPPKQWLKIFPIRVVLDAIAGLRSLIALKPRETWAIIRAYKDAHFMKGIYKETRPSDEGPIVLPDYERSVIVDYFVKGKKQFSDLEKNSFI